MILIIMWCSFVLHCNKPTSNIRQYCTVRVSSSLCCFTVICNDILYSKRYFPALANWVTTDETSQERGDFPLGRKCISLKIKH